MDSSYYLCNQSTLQCVPQPEFGSPLYDESKYWAKWGSRANCESHCIPQGPGGGPGTSQFNCACEDVDPFARGKGPQRAYCTQVPYGRGQYNSRDECIDNCQQCGTDNPSPFLPWDPPYNPSPLNGPTRFIPWVPPAGPSHSTLMFRCELDQCIVTKATDIASGLRSGLYTDAAACIDQCIL
mgnify:CR=1 FL=1